MLRHTLWAIAAVGILSGSAAAAPTLAEHDGAIDIVDGGSVIATFKPATPALRRGTAVVREHTLEKRRVLELRIPVRGTSAEEVWIAEAPSGSKPRPLWTGMSGPRDADGESSLRVEVVDGRLLEYQTSVQVARCDGQPVRLFPRAWSFASGGFVPAPHQMTPPPAQKIVATRTTTENAKAVTSPAGAPAPAFRWTSASSSAGAGSDARSLAAPSKVDDGNAATAWISGSTGSAAGEFLSARTGAGAVPVVGLRVLPGHAASTETYRRHNVPRALRVLLGAKPEQQFLVELPGGDDLTKPFWVPLPRPVETACVTVMIEDVLPPGHRRGVTASEYTTTAISELEVVTDLDGPGGAERLVKMMAEGGDCSGRVSLLVGFGPGAVLPAARAAAGAQGLGRECLIEALTRLAPSPTEPEVIQALVGALKNASEREERLLTPVLQRTPAALAAVGALLANHTASDADRARAARVLAGAPGEQAAAALLAAAGDGSPALRTAVVSAGAQSAAMSVGLIAARLRAEQQAPASRRGELLRMLGLRARNDAAAREQAVPVIKEMLSGSTEFEVQARAVAALGAIGNAAAAAELASLRAGHADPTLRFLATRELAAIRVPETLAHLRLALTDTNPRVRETAAAALGLRKDKDAAAAIIAASKQESWPFARRAEVDAIGRLCTPVTSGTSEAADLLMRAAEVDVPEVRATAMTGLVRCRDPRAAGLLLAVLDRRPEGAGLRELAARLLGQVRNPQLAAALSKSIPRILVESQEDMALESVAAAALPSLARQGGPEALGLAVELSSDKRPVIQRAAVEALGVLCDPARGAAALHAAATGSDAALSTLARSLERRCATKK